jgi:DNA polymerase-3 subunit epsilon
MKSLCFDTETTGLPSFDLPADDPSQPRICSIAMTVKGNVTPGLYEYYWKIKPDGWTVPDEVSKIHGLTTELLMQEGEPIGIVLENFCGFYDSVDQLIGYNISFDLKLLRGELRRLGMEDRYGTKLVRDIMKECTPVCRIPGKRGYKWPKLSEAVKIILGRDHFGAHDAMADVRATVELSMALDERIGAGQRAG